ncbi:unnamed protein product [Zymoseptoria tritici ST99CH_3D7]|uniref:Chromo domain-containing protein n=1 Tax=Zymoseptoria tritici (strain ST99CH_3D7) TaxID=1276538 RepID=A0A1X7RQH5_ZYMT9|nr:unnamed protein product [Zymoseptoria tritici ST99CH_3D7]
MPPAVSDNEDSDIDVPDAIPARPKAVEDPKSEDDDDEEEEDEYQVEKILAHESKRGKIQYRIKWLGYEDEADQTWEPQENLAGAVELLKEYHRSIGGTPEPTKGSAKKTTAKTKAARRTTGDIDSPAPAAKRQKGNGSKSANGEWSPPLGTWENDVTAVQAIIEDEPSGDAVRGGKKDTKSLEGLLEWNNGRKTQHKMDVLRTKCPQRLLDYYENHLVFRGDPNFVEG